MPPTALPRRILLSGSSGLLGRHLAAALREGGDTVVPLVRRPNLPGTIFWDPPHQAPDPALLSGFDAVIHLAGEPVAGVWTARKRQRILQSRVEGTQMLVRALGAAARPPGVLLCASGINVYGDGGDAVMEESCPAGRGFLAEVCVGWEAAAAQLAPLARVVPLRIGVVLASDGGALAALVPLFRLGLGGVAADGGNYLSWIGMEDLVRAVCFLLREPVRGPVNLVAPNPVTGRQFAAALGAALHRPALLRVPARLLRLVFGQMAEETALSSLRVVPATLLRSGFRFAQPDIREALAALPLRG